MAKFPFPPNGKAHVDHDDLESIHRVLPVSVSIPSKREGTCRLTPFSTQMSRGSGHPQTKRELRGAFFLQKFTPKTPRTLINIEPNAIFQEKRPESLVSSGFLGNFSNPRI